MTSFRRANLDLSRGHLRVDDLVVPLQDLSHNLQDPLGSHRSRQLVQGSVRRVEHDLDLAVPVAQVDKHEAAVVAVAVHPTTHGDRLTDPIRAQFATGMRPQHNPSF